MPLRMTMRTQPVLRALLKHPGHELYGLELRDVAGAGPR